MDESGMPPSGGQPTLQELVAKLLALRKTKDTLKGSLELINGEMDQLMLKVKELMEVQGVVRFKTADGTLYMQTSAWPKVQPGQEEALIFWFDQLAKPELAPRKLNGSRLREYFETAMEQDLPLPPSELVEFRPSNELRFMPAKGSTSQGGAS